MNTNYTLFTVYNTLLNNRNEMGLVSQDTSTQNISIQNTSIQNIAIQKHRDMCIDVHYDLIYLSARDFIKKNRNPEIFRFLRKYSKFLRDKDYTEVEDIKARDSTLFAIDHILYLHEIKKYEILLEITKNKIVQIRDNKSRRGYPIYNMKKNTQLVLMYYRLITTIHNMKQKETIIMQSRSSAIKC